MKFVKDANNSFSIEITPLIDIVFLLVIFFVVTSKVGDSQFLELSLPETESFTANIVEYNNEIIIFNDGTLSINNEIISINDKEILSDMIFNFDNSKVLLSADGDANHSWVMEIMDILNTITSHCITRITNIKFTKAEDKFK